MSSRPIPLDLLPDSATVNNDGSLSIGGCSVADLAEQYGTPLFVYDEEHIRARCREAVAAFGVDRVIYASKAFMCSAMARLVSEEGLLLDVASGGELYVAMHGGVPASRCTLHGNNKSIEELEMAITKGVRHIVVDSFDEIERLETLSRRGLPAPKLMIRVTPGVHAHTHDFIATGQDDSKFGFNLGNGDAAKAIVRIQNGASDGAKAGVLIGVHCHIGSNVLAVNSFAKAAEIMAEFSKPYGLPELTLGGGLGVAYTEGEEAPTITMWGSVLLDACETLGVTAEVSVEPGRAIVASSAITVYRVGTVKEIPGIRTYISVDGGMSANPTFTQALANATQHTVEISPILEATTLGAAFLAGLAVGTWAGWDDIESTWRPSRVVEPSGAAHRERWASAIERASGWHADLSSFDF